MRGILSGVFQRSLKWAHTSAWTGSNPGSIMPPFREDFISTKSDPITKESVFTWIIWKKLLQMVQHTQLPLPKAHKIIPEIVARWNCSKGRIDEMTCYLDGMNFLFAWGT